MNPATLRAASKLNLIRILSSHPDGLTLEELQKITGHKSISELKNELGELYMIEMYPYSPQDCIDIDFDGEKVKISLPVSIDKVLPLSPEEWILLRNLISATKAQQDAPFDQMGEQILRKIDTIIPSGDWKPNQQIKDFIKNAIANKHIIKIVYWRRDKNQKEERLVQPWILWEENDSYLLAFDLDKKEFRSYRTDCILAAESTSELAIDFPSNAKDWLDGFIQLVNPDKIEQEKMASVYLTDSSSYHLGQKLPLIDQNKSINVHGENFYLYEVPIREENWFVNTILGYGKSAIIVSPIAIKKRILSLINESFSNVT
jgi:proteasome accessory factor C